MISFPTLEEFLVFKDETGSYDYTSLPGKIWLVWYNLSREAYFLCGDEGPPIGSKVITLRDGFGGSKGSIRKIVATSEPRFDNYFLLRSLEKNNSQYLSYKPTWWRDLYPYPNDKEEGLAIEGKIDCLYKY